MNHIRIRKHIDSETLHLPELRPLIVADVEIIVVPDAGRMDEDRVTIQKTPGVCGGDACVGNTRIPVWTLVEFKRLGRTDDELLADFPSLSRTGVLAAWDYARSHPDEIEEAIA